MEKGTCYQVNERLERDVGKNSISDQLDVGVTGMGWD